MASFSVLARALYVAAVIVVCFSSTEASAISQWGKRYATKSFPRNVATTDEISTIYSDFDYTSIRGGGRVGSIPNNFATICRIRARRAYNYIGPKLGFLWRRRSPYAHYRAMLMEQRDLLERQLRQSREELVALRHQYAELQKSRRTSADKSEVIKAYKLKITELEEELKQATQASQDISKLLALEQKKVKALQAKVHLLETANDNVKEQYEQELALLKKEFDDQATQQLATLQQTLHHQLHVAVATAQRQAGLEQATAIAETESRLQRQHSSELKALQQQADAAVEREKVKMRKLIKALAEREKKLVATAEREIKQTRKRSVKGNNAAKNQQQPSTLRGPR
jgi:hypothetical protein